MAPARDGDALNALTLPGMPDEFPLDDWDRELQTRFPSLILKKGPTKKGLLGRALFSECFKFRYVLTREWGDPANALTFICLNPSTATHIESDPTVTRAVEFAKLWGFSAFVMLNLFAYRSTDPFLLRTQPDPAGPDNDRAIQYFARRSPRVVAAWGNHGGLRGRDAHVRVMLADVDLLCFGFSKTTSSPLHPLYLAANSQLIPLKGARC